MWSFALPTSGRGIFGAHRRCNSTAALFASLIGDHLTPTLSISEYQKLFSRASPPRKFAHCLMKILTWARLSDYPQKCVFHGCFESDLRCKHEDPCFGIQSALSISSPIYGPQARITAIVDIGMNRMLLCYSERLVDHPINWNGSAHRKRGSRKPDASFSSCWC